MNSNVKFRAEILVVMLIIVTLLTGCNNTIFNSNIDVKMEERFIVGQDHSYMFQGRNNFQYIVKAEEGYYFRLNDILYYGDEKLETLVPLCTQPNCLHSQAPTLELKQKCGAYIGNSVSISNIQYYDKTIYITTMYDLLTKEMNAPNGLFRNLLYAISADGSIKKKVDGYEHKALPPIFHRGYMYYAFSEIINEDIDGKLVPITYGGIARRSLETGKDEILLDRSSIILAEDGVQEVYAYHNYVYFRIRDKKGEPYLFIFSLLDNTLKEIEKKEGKTPNFYFVDNKLIYKYPAGDETEKLKIYISDLDGSNGRYIMDISDYQCRLGADDKYIYEDICMKAEVVLGKEDRILRYYDKETYEYLGEVNLGRNKSWENIGFGDENYFFFFEFVDGKQRLMYFDKADLATGNVEFRMLLEWVNS